MATTKRRQRGLKDGKRRKIYSMLFGNNSGGGAASILDGAPFFAQLTKSLVLNRGTGLPTFTRATSATVQNNDGYQVATLSGEARFQGARRVRDLVATSDFSAASWAAFGVKTLTSGATDPDGGTTAYTLSSGAGNGIQMQNMPCTALGKIIFSVWCKATTGTQVRLQLISSGGVGATTNTLQTITTSWARYTIEVSPVAGDILVQCRILTDASANPVLIWHPQVEDVTSQTTQTAGEYVSVGVLSAPYHGAGVDGVKYFDTDISGNPIPLTTLKGYLAEGARTNLCLQSNAFTTTWTGAGTPAATQNAIGPDGATSAWTLTDDSAVANEGITQNITPTAADHTFSVFVAKTTGAQASYPALTVTRGGTAAALCTIDTTNGVATVWTAYTGLTIIASSATCIRYNDAFWRVSLTYLGTAVAHTHDVYPAVTANATQSTGTFNVTSQGSAVFYGAQVELGSFASTYIPTTTIAVARNADVLTYPSAGNIDGTKGWAYAEFSSNIVNNVASPRIIDTNGAVPSIPLYAEATTNKITLYDGTAARNGGSVTMPVTAPKKIASSWETGASVAVSGSVTTGLTFDGNMNVGANIYIGNTNLSAGNEPFGTIRSVRIGQRQLSASEMQAVTK